MDIPATQKITTFLMFEGRAGEAMAFYLSLFDDAEMITETRYGPGGEGAAGTVQHATFRIAGQQFMCIDSPAHHDFGFTPSMSLFTQCSTEAELDRLFAALSQGGTVLMPPGDYGFSVKFAWLNDRFGVSWQLNLGA